MSGIELTPQMITQLLAGQRNRGGHERFIRSFVESGEMYTVVTERPEYAGRDNIGSLKNMLTQVAAKCELKDTVRFVKHENALIAINTAKVDNGSDE